MAKLTENITIKRLQNKYRLVIMNDDTFEEVVTFKVSRVSLYITLSSAFILLVGLTTCLLVFTPLKYYIPGYGNKKSLTQLQLLKYRTDSLEQAIKYNQQYFDGVQKAIVGNQTMVLDSTKIDIKVDNSHDDREPTKEERRKKKRRRR
jgi:hypothetical protein